MQDGKDKIAELKRTLTSKYMSYVRKEVSQEDYMDFQKEVREQISQLEGQITVAKGTDARAEEVEERLKPLADGAIAAEKNGLTKAMVTELIKNVWMGEEIEVEFKADGLVG